MTALHILFARDLWRHGPRIASRNLRLRRYIRSWGIQEGRPFAVYDLQGNPTGEEARWERDV